MSHKCVCGAVGELPIGILATGLQQAFAAISPNTIMGCLKLTNAAALQSASAATPSPQPTAAVPTTATTEPTPETPSAEDTGCAILERQAFPTEKLQARRLELLMVFLCPYPVTTVAISVRSEVAEPSDESTTSKMLAVGGLKK